MTEQLRTLDAAIPTQARPLDTPGAITAPNAFIANIEQILVPGGHASDELAQKVLEISERFVWCDPEVLVLPQQPDPNFLDYARSFGITSTVVVPSGVDHQRLAIRDNVSEPEVAKALEGKWVESYIGDRALFLALDRLGIRYGNGDPNGSIRTVNHKGNVRGFMEGLVQVPPGTLVTGIDKVTHATLERIADEGAAFVRLAESGGGLGNRYFSADELRGMSPAEASAYVRDKLNGTRPDLWENGDALVERALELGSSPSSNFNTLTKEVIDGDQIMHGNDYWGVWLPAPSWRYDRGQIRDVGHGVRDRVKDVGFWARGGVDLGIASAKSMDAPKDVMVAFEINGRSTALRHVVAIADRLWGPYDQWTREGKAVKALDHFELSKKYSFQELHNRLDKAGLLASLENPFGIVITIPPQHGVAGIQVMGKSYEDAEKVYRQALSLVGNPTTNTEDYPIFTPKMERI